MQRKYLEDIVEEEKGLHTKKFVDKLIEFPNNLIFEHPFAVAISSFLAGHYTLAYIEKNYPQYKTPADYDALMFGVYGIYSILGLFKEYVLERRSPKLKDKNLYKWFLDNPKIAAAIGAVFGAYVCYKGEINIQDLLLQNDTIKLGNKITSGMLLGGSLTEIISRGLKNLGRINKSIKKLKTNLAEKAWNILFEHPFVASAITTIATFNIVYSRPASRTAPLSTGSGRAFILKGKLLEDIVENPGKIGDLFLQSSLVGITTLASILTAGSIFHSHSLRELSLRARKTYNEFKGRTQEAIKYQERIANLPNSLERTIEDTVELGNLYYEEYEKTQNKKHYVEAFAQYRRALRLFTKKQEHISYADFFRKTLKIDKILRYFKRRKNYLSREQKSINQIFIDLLNKDYKALDELKILAEQSSDMHIVYLYGKAMEIFGYAESGRVQKELAVRKELKTRKTIEESVTKNIILRFNDDFFRAEVIGKKAIKENLVKELKATKELREIIRDFEGYDVPLPIGIIKTEGEEVYCMEYVSGRILKDVLESTNNDKGQAVSYFKRTAEFLGLIHATLKPDGQPRQYEKRIKRRLISHNVNNDLVKRIVDNLYPVIGSLQGIEIVVNKDAHPENWIIDEFDDIISIDLELDGVIPITIDTAKLLNWYELSNAEIMEVLNEHLRSFKRHSSREPLKVDYQFALLNSIIVRSLTSYSSLKSTKEISLKNALTAIERIKEGFTQEYKTNESAYQELYAAINTLRLSSNS